MPVFSCLTIAALKGLKRDKTLWSLVAVALLLMAVVPVVSLLSMRQVRELAMSLSLSGIGLFLLISTVFLGSVSIWRDLERRFAVAVLTLPLSRSQFIIGKFAALALFLVFSLGVLSLLAVAGVFVAESLYPGEKPFAWVSFGVALGMLGIKYLLLLSVSILLSTLSTSFFLPVFGSLGLYLAGSASFQVVEFMLQSPDRYAPGFVRTVQFLHYLIPNFSAFDYQVYAIYSLPLPWQSIAISVIYGCVYAAAALFLAAFFFSRREL